MPRRKQQAPRRSAAYVPEELKEAAMMDEGVEGAESVPGEEPPVKHRRSERDFLAKDPPGFQDSPAGELSSREMDSESHLSECSDRMSDFESASIKNEEEEAVVKSALPTTTAATTTPGEDGPAAPDTLDRMKAIYSSFLTNSYWSTLGLNLAQPGLEKSQRSSSSSSSSTSSSGSYDWHQSAMAKTLQQASQNPTRHQPEPSLFSTVQLYRQSAKLYGSIFSGASKFRCKDCSAAYDTLVELTVHMNETGHYRDDNHDTDGNSAKRWSKPRKRSLLEMEGKEDAQKVLKCMYCGHSFESLQDLSVHMIKTKHYQKVPLKEPMNPMATKIMSSGRKRAPELDLPNAPASPAGTPKPLPMDPGEVLQKATHQYITSKSRHGHQNGSSYAWQFESRKSQILKCMECGNSYNNLQELTAHMMVTGHFIKVTSSAIKKGKPLGESPLGVSPTTPSEENVQSVPLAATSFPPTPVAPPSSISPKLRTEIKEEEKERACTQEATGKDKQVPDEEEDEKPDVSKYHYLTEEDLEGSPKEGVDILKSLENTVTSAINKAQNGAPAWGGYPSIHAAYQLPNIMKLSLASSGKSSPLKYVFTGGEILSPAKSQPLLSPSSSQASPLPQNNFQAMEELVKKVTEKVAKVEEKMKNHRANSSPHRRTTPSPCSSDAGGSSRGASPKNRRAQTPQTNGTDHKDCNGDSREKESLENGTSHVNFPSSALCGSTAIITDHPPEQPFINPLSALQSVMNVHLGKAAKPALPALDPMSMLFKMSNSLGEKAAVATPSVQTKKREPSDQYFYQVSDDQPIDLTKGKSSKSCPSGSALLSPTATSSSSSSFSSSSATTSAKTSAVATFMSDSPLRENALSDISDMLRNLTEGHASKSPTPTGQSDAEGATPEDLEEVSPAQKRKGRQSNWNPQHLLILQAQFAASLRQAPDGKYVLSDLSPQERMYISRFTGLSMTTISHWLANVKYQLRRTGGTKFLKNLDSGNPVFFCSDCASQIRTPSTYVTHLETHLGFRLRDLAKLSNEQLGSQVSRHPKGPSEKTFFVPSPSPSPRPPRGRERRHFLPLQALQPDFREQTRRQAAPE
ncbi:hypothetical protein MATL_G00144890 [Megalops atlanticus]|uniref:C2H2-type domain-containing protein n=1 Tax=Megalops atlanticus TaxID=7932 RepID=A0A9D3TB65_MEGAT|nr:hypothetical protein MATL_G00144890 [Megalops atlanticus]